MTNINGSNINSGAVAMPYTPPAPPEHSDQHRYTVALYKQDKLINERASKRDKFDVNSFVQRNRLVDPIQIL